MLEKQRHRRSATPSDGRRRIEKIADNRKAAETAFFGLCFGHDQEIGREVATDKADRCGDPGGGGGSQAVVTIDGKEAFKSVTPDDELRQQLLKMTRVAEATGQPLGGETVRNFLRRRNEKSSQ